MKPDDEIVETPHGPATVLYVREHDIPHWQHAAAHAREVIAKLMASIGVEPPKRPDIETMRVLLKLACLGDAKAATDLDSRLKQLG